MDDKKVEKQIAMLYNGGDKTDSGDLIRYVIDKTLRIHHEFEVGAKTYFAIDYKEDMDLSKEPPCDIIIFENVEGEAAKREARDLAIKANRAGRIFVPLGSNFITKDDVGPLKSIFTYSINDQSANICVNRLKTLPEGGYDCDLVYQFAPAGRRKSLKEIMFPTYNQNLFGRARVNSRDKADVLKVVKAFAMGMALSVESKLIGDAIGGYVFESMAKEEEEKKVSSPTRGWMPSREKEFEED
ncbi:MAG: hypothetical protein II918_02945 [Firmicutes bacterium]|nr:hypothetical protein [Bacillota bacterium]